MSEMEHVVVRGDEIEITVLPGAGARLHSLRIRGQDIMRTPGDIAQHFAEPFFWGGFVMAPWCNRLTPRAVRVGRRVVDLPPNFTDGSAIHGQVYVAAWRQTGDLSFAIERDGKGWPWRYRVSAEYSIEGMKLSLNLRLRNLSDERMPAGIGLHPWFPTPVQVRVNSALTYGNAKSSSVQPVSVEGDLDLRARATMAEGVDATWASPGDPPLELWWPSGLHAVVQAPCPTLHIVGAYAPERGAIAVEPQTHAPQGLRRLLNDEPGAMRLIDPDEDMTLAITIQFDGAA
jgi:aldose 1-epimerase